MRPLPTEWVPKAPPYVRGVAIVRGTPTPVVDLNLLLGVDDASPPARLVTLKLEAGRRVAVLVDEVLGVRDRGDLPEGQVPPLLQDAADEFVDDLTRLDRQLLSILRAGALVPADMVAEPPKPDGEP